MIYTFYSFKGGVGRSMALANVAEYLASRGARVLLIDWDLEAPGLESFFFAPDDPRFAEIRCQLGLIDYLDQYRREYSGVRSSETAFEDALESLRPLEKLLTPIHPTEARTGTTGDLWLLPAGWRMSRKGTSSGDKDGADDRFAKYAATVQDFGWADFYASYEGERFFTWFRDRLLNGTGSSTNPALHQGFDAVLIDSRTGVTEVGGVCTRQLADVVVAFCAPNYQNLAGTERMTAAFVRSEERRQRGDDEIEVLVVPARVDEAGETDAQNEFRRQFLAAVKTPDALSESSATSWDLLIPYVTKYAYAESLTVGRSDSNQRLEQAYRNLATHLVLLSRPDSRLRSCLSEDLQVIRRRRPRIFVTNNISAVPGVVAIAPGLEGLNLAAHASDASSLLVILNGVDLSLHTSIKQQIRLARQRGACVYAASSSPAQQVPRILRRAPLFKLPEQQSEMIRQLQAPCQSRRSPNMAPALAPGYVELPEHLERLNAALLQGQDSSPALVSLNGPPGSGKTGLAARLCMEEDILDEYADGILWVSPGESGDVIGCLRAILTAFTGETAKETTVADAVARVAQHLVGTSCLLVIDDVIRREHLQPFLQLGSVARLVLPRDPAIVPEARSIALEFMSNAQATDVLLAALPTETNRALVSSLAYRIGGWPGALAVTRTQLAQAVTRGEPADAAVARMIAELESGNVTVLGEGAAILQQRARRRIDGAMKELTAPEHELFRDFRAFHDKPTVPIDSFPARWTLGEDRFRRILAAFERRNLIALDPSRDAIEIPVFVALYIRELRDAPTGSTLTAFVLRPLGFKHGIDFDLVERDLMAPAMNQLGVRTLTCGSFLENGDLRPDMFQLLLTADIVLADVSMPESNVFYDLGIRHALRPRSTILLSSATGDGPRLTSDRVLTYTPRDPASSLDALVRLALETLASDRVDSPVFRLAPDLPPADLARVVLVPTEFREDVQAASENRAAADLRLFSEEVRDLLWAGEGLRLIGRAQNAIRSWEGAAETWEALLARNPNEHEANLVLGQVYRSLNRFDEATRVIDRVLALPDLPAATRGEAQVFKGAVARRRWRDEWEAAADRAPAALRSPRLIEAFDHYAAGFREDLNLHYAGLSALWLVTAIVELARALPEVWQEQFETPGEAQFRLDSLGGHRRALTSAVGLALDRAVAHGSLDFWLRASVAEHRLLAGGKPGFIAAEYRKVVADAPPSAARALRSQLVTFSQLGIMPEGINAALGSLPPSTDPADVFQGTSTIGVLFAGHMLDSPDRTRPRFPPTAEPVVFQALVNALHEIAAAHADQRVVGVAGASAGGDILFHEACMQIGTPSIVCLPVPAREYVASSVQYAGAGWVGRFQRLLNALTTHELSRTSDLPRWLRDKPLYSTWERNLSWELYLALETGRNNMMLLALWDDTTTSARGGVADFVNQTKTRGLPVAILNLAKLREGMGS